MTDEESAEISIIEAVAFSYISTKEWLTSKELAKKAGLNRRTTQKYCRKWTDLGLCDLLEVWPGHMFRLSPRADKRNIAYLKRMRFVQQVLGLPDGLKGRPRKFK